MRVQYARKHEAQCGQSAKQGWNGKIDARRQYLPQRAAAKINARERRNDKTSGCRQHREMRQRAKPYGGAEKKPATVVGRIVEKIFECLGGDEDQEQQTGIAARFGSIVDEDGRAGDQRRGSERGCRPAAQAEFCGHGNGQSAEDDRFETNDNRRRCRADHPQPERIQEMIIILRDAPKNVADIGNGLEILDRPDFIEPEITARTENPQQQADNRQGENGNRECAVRAQIGGYGAFLHASHVERSEPLKTGEGRYAIP